MKTIWNTAWQMFGLSFSLSWKSLSTLAKGTAFFEILFRGWYMSAYKWGLGLDLSGNDNTLLMNITFGSEDQGKWETIYDI